MDSSVCPSVARSFKTRAWNVSVIKQSANDIEICKSWLQFLLRK